MLQVPHDDVLAQAATWRGEGKGVAIATVVTTWGSAPRSAGSQLAIDHQGAFVGSVSGGCVEGAVVREALAVIADGKPRLLDYGVTNERAWEVGLACGGRIQIYVERLDESDRLLGRLNDARARGVPVALATALKSGRQALFYLDGGPAGWPEDVAVAARAALLTDRAATVDTAEGPVFLNVFAPPPRMIAVGAVHIAQALAPMAGLAGYRVTVVDPRRAFATDARFPGVDLSTDWPDEAMAALKPDLRTAIVTLTHDPKLDDPALEAGLRSDAFYLGALGSPKTHAARLQRLRERGFDEGLLARVHGPVGLPIGARSPAEIAISILAQVTQSLRQAAR
jgi:xanthine dehydrogenase accessory factor